MTEDFKFSLKNASSLMMTPQDGLKNIESDLSSVFGNYNFKNELKGIPLHHSDENLETPFSKDKFMANIFEENSNKENQNLSYDDAYDWEEPLSSLEFEC